MLVILALVGVLAAVAEAAPAGLFVVFADVWGVVGEGDCADVRGRFDGTDGAGGGVGVLGDEGLVAGGAFVGAVVAGRVRVLFVGGGVVSRGAEEGFGVAGRVVVPVGRLGCVVCFRDVGGAVGGECGGGEVLGRGFGRGV